MKKILTTAAAVFALVAVSNAQLFVGGNLGFSTESNTYKNTADGTTYTDTDGDAVKRDGTTKTINFNPKVGFQLNDNMSVGGTLMLGTSTSKEFDGTKDNKVYEKTSSNTIGIAPFFRYSFVEFGGFKLSADASLPLSMRFGKTTYPDRRPNQTTDREDVKNSKTMGIGLNIVPVISYSISDRIDLEAQLNVFNLGFNFSSRNPYPEGDNNWDEIRSNSTSFNLGVSPNNVCTTGAIQIGMIFKF